MVGVGMWFFYRVKRLEGENKDLLQLAEQIDELRDHIGTMQTHVGELSERLDFAERMLARGGEKRELPRDEARP